MKAMLNIPADFALRLKGLEELLPEIITLGLIETHPNFEFNPNELSQFKELSDFLEFLTTLPHPEQLLSYQTTPKIRNQVSTLISKQKIKELFPEEKTKLKLYEFLLLLILRAKVNAIDKLKEVSTD